MAARTAESWRTSCAEKLTSSMRQLKKYIEGEKPIARVIRDKIAKVDGDREALIAAHSAYAEKANISIETEEMRTYINDKVDAAVDLTDDAECVLDEQDSTRRSKSEKHEFESCTTSITSTITTLEAHMVNENSTAEADALYAESILCELQAKESQFLKSVHVLKELITDEEEKEAITTQQTNTITLLQGTHTKGKQFIAKIRAQHTPKAEERSTDTGKPDVRIARPSHPTFSGNARDFARFKGEYKVIVEPAYPDDALRMYALKHQCLKGAAYELVKNINDLNKIWERLTERYGDNNEIVDTIIKEIKDTCVIKSDRSLVNFVDLLDQGIQDLIAIGQEKQFGGAYTVRIIEDKLPKRVLYRWADVDTSQDGEERFKDMLKFLRAERKETEKVLNQKNDSDDRDTRREVNQMGARGGDGRESRDDSREERRGGGEDEEVLTDKEEGRSAWFTTTATTLHVNVTHLTIGCPSTRELKW